MPMPFEGASTIGCSDLYEVLERIERLFAREGIPAGRLEKIGFAHRWTMVLAGGGQSGMAFNYTGEHAIYGPVDPSPIEAMRQWVGGDLLTAVRELLSWRGLLARSVCVAMLNALSRPLCLERRLLCRGIVPRQEEDFSFVRRGEKVVVIGCGGVAEPLRRRCDTLHISDMRSPVALQTLTVDSGVHYGPSNVVFHGAEDNEALLSDADVLFMTGAVLVNGTFEELMGYARNARIVGMFGPSAQILPDFLIDKRVHYITTSVLKDPEALFDCLTESVVEGRWGDYTEPRVVWTKGGL